MIGRIGCRSSGRIWLMKVLNRALEKPCAWGPRHFQSLPMESRAKIEPGSGKHSVYTHFPKDPNCDICLRTKITRDPCRRRGGTVVPKAEQFGDLITADYKIISEESESRYNHRDALVVLDLATQWLDSYPCQTKTSQETQKSQMKFLEPTRKPKVIYSDSSLDLASLARNYFWIIVRQHHTDLKQLRLQRAVRRVKEGTSAVLLQSGLYENCWADSIECYCYLRNIQDHLSDGKTPCEWRFGIPLNGPVLPFGAMVEYHRIFAKDTLRFGPKVLPGIFLGYVLYAGQIWKGDIMVADIEECGGDGRIRTPRKKAQSKGSVITPMKGDNFLFCVADGTVKTLEEIDVWDHPLYSRIVQNVKTTLQKTRFRSVNLYKEFAYRSKLSKWLQRQELKIDNTKHRAKPNNVWSDLQHLENMWVWA